MSRLPTGTLLLGALLLVWLSATAAAAGGPASLSELAGQVEAMQRAVTVATTLESNPLRPAVAGVGLGLGLGLCVGAGGAYLRRVSG